MSTCVLHTPADDLKGKNVTEKEKNMSLNKNLKFGYNRVLINNHTTHLYPPTKKSANITHKEYYFLTKSTIATNARSSNIDILLPHKNIDNVYNQTLFKKITHHLHYNIITTMKIVVQNTT